MAKSKEFDMKHLFDPLLTYLRRYIPIAREELLFLLPYLEVRNYEKKDFILNAGQVEYYFNIVMYGLVRKGVNCLRGDMTLQLASEGHFIHSEVSFHRQTDSETYIEAVETSTVVSIHYNNLKIAMGELRWLEKLMDAVTTDMFIKKDERSIMNLRSRTRERFVEYVEKNPHMMQRVPQKVLATYLNIQPETFSRLKHLLKTK